MAMLALRRPARFGDQPDRPERRRRTRSCSKWRRAPPPQTKNRSKRPRRTGRSGRTRRRVPADRRPAASRRRRSKNRPAEEPAAAETAAAGNPRSRNAAAGQARVPDRARRKRLRRHLRRDARRRPTCEDAARKGELLTNYYAVTQGRPRQRDRPDQRPGADAGNRGQLPELHRHRSPAPSRAEGQVEGNGCVYPAATPTLPGQLVEKRLKWKAYVEDIGNGAAAGQPATCRHPALGGPDPSQAPVPGDAYETWRNPFVYFHSLIDSPECAEDDVGLEQLPPDLEDGEEDAGALLHRPQRLPRRRRSCPANRGSPAGPLAAEAFLQDGRAGDRGLARLQGRRADRDHLRPGAADRRRTPTPAPAASRRNTRTCPPPKRRRSRHRPGQTDAAVAAASGCC